MSSGESIPPAGSDRLPAATFKNSLRLWQARWKSQQASGQVGDQPSDASEKASDCETVSEAKD